MVHENQVYTGINNTGPGYMLGIVNVTSGCNAINVKTSQTGNATVFFVTDAGITSVIGTLNIS